MFVAALLLATLPQASASAAPKDWLWSDFPVFVWRQRYSAKPLPEQLIAPFGGTNVHRDEPIDWIVNGGYAFYVSNAAGRNDLHRDADDEWQAFVERWKQAPETTPLVRSPCLTALKTRDRLQATLRGTLRARGGDHGFGLSLGDEVSMNPSGHPLDLCRSETCEAYASHWPGAEGAPLTEKVRRDLFDGDRSTLGTWLARRRFHREVLTELIGDLANDSFSERTGLLGISPASAFGGVDVGALLKSRLLNFVELYPALDARAHHAWMSGRSRPRSLATVFLQDDTPDGVAWQAWEHWVRGGDGLVIWSDAYLEDRKWHRERLAEAVADIRAVDALVPDVPPAPIARVALLSDPDSAAAAWLRDSLLDGPSWTNRYPSYQREFGTYERKVRAWLRLIEDCGEIPGAVGFGSRLARVDVLVLPCVYVLGESDVRLLERLLDTTRIVLVVDGELGWADREGHRWDVDVLERLRAEHPDRVLDAPAGLDAYPSRRVGKPNARLRAFLEDALQLAGADRSSVAIRSDEDVPLLVTRRPGENKSYFAAIPNLPAATDRKSALRSIRLSVDAGGRSIEWIHPLGAVDGVTVTLRAGDAAVFSLAE